MAEHAKKNSDAYQITWLIRRIFRSMSQVSTQRLNIDDMTAADRALMEFLYPDNSLSVPAIAEKYNVSRQHVQKTVNPLIKNNLISSVRNPDHKRSPLLKLTAKGKSLFEKILKDDLQTIEKWFADMEGRERERLRIQLEKLHAKVMSDV